MNFETACKILELPESHEIDEHQITKSYRKLSLKYHPDKNSSPNANEDFRKLCDAKIFLETYLDGDLSEEEYEDNYTDFDSYVTRLISQNHILYLLYKIWNSETGKMVQEKMKKNFEIACEEQILYFASTIHLKLLRKLYSVVLMYKDKWNLSEEFVNKLYLIYEERCLI